MPRINGSANRLGNVSAPEKHPRYRKPPTAGTPVEGPEITHTGGDDYDTCILINSCFRMEGMREVSVRASPCDMWTRRLGHTLAGPGHPVIAMSVVFHPCPTLVIAGSPNLVQF